MLAPQTHRTLPSTNSKALLLSDLCVVIQALKIVHTTTHHDNYIIDVICCTAYLRDQHKQTTANSNNFVSLGSNKVLLLLPHPLGQPVR
jgi:hypothetical protein